MGSPQGIFAVHLDHKPVDCAVASWTAPVLWRFWLARLHRQSARRLAHSKTWRELPRFMESLLDPTAPHRDHDEPRNRGAGRKALPQRERGMGWAPRFRERAH